MVDKSELGQQDLGYKIYWSFPPFVGLQTIQSCKFVCVMMDRHVLDIETSRVVKG